MKNVTWIFVVVLLFSLTAFIDKNRPTSGLSVGNIAPNFTLCRYDSEEKIDLKALKGNYVLLSFWASYDATSRVKNALLNHEMENLPQRVKMVSVSFDEYASIFNETIKQDRIKGAYCMVDTTGEASGLFDLYHLNKGFKNYLLNKKGQIIATNVTAKQLSQLIKETKE